MSTAILDDFVTLLTENPEIIPDRDSLQLQLDRPYEDVYELAEMVGEYCKAHPDLKDAMKSVSARPKPEPKPEPEPEPTATATATDVESERLPGKGNTRPVLQVTDYKHTILNTMHRVVATATPASSAKPQP